MKDVALLVIDMQMGLFDLQPYRIDAVMNQAQNLIAKARAHGCPIIYTRHDGGAGDTFEKGTSGWEIHPAFAPCDADMIFDKQFNSAFRQTGLQAYLDTNGIRTLILVGMQTEYCIDATCKVAFEHGYEVIIPLGATTTLDNGGYSAGQITRFYETQIWANRFAQVIPVAAVLQLMA